MDLFTLKKIIGVLIMPLSLIIILLLLALIFHRSRAKFSFKCLLSGCLLLLFSSVAPIANLLMLPIEKQYQAFTKATIPVDYIVILGCGHSTSANLPATSQLKTCSLQRLVEGLRVFHLHPEATLITSGAALGDSVANAVKVQQAAISLGVPEHKIIVEPYPKDTEEEAVLIAPRVTGSHVVLVTNFDHMPRAMKYFTAQGINVTPAPASPWVKGLDEAKDWRYFVPNVSVFMQTTNACYEYIGQVVQWLKSMI